MLRILGRAFCAFLLLAAMFASASPAGAKKARETPIPAAPQTLSASSVSYNSVALRWTAPAVKKGTAITYLVYKDNAYLDRTAETSYIVTGLSPNTVYTFYVKAQDSGGNLSAPSNIFAALTLAEPAPVPSAAPPSALPPETESQDGAEKIIAGYYASWAAYGGYGPDDIAAQALTHINYAFAAIGEDLKIAMGDPYIDPKNFEAIKSLKAGHPGLKILISVGGWNGSARFSDVAASDASRTAFADSAVDFIVRYGFDGIDLDWEYPVSGGKAGNAARNEDRTNFTLLLARLRERLDARGEADGKRYLLSFAGGAGSWYLNNIEPDKASAYADYAIIMAYDIHGPWDCHADLNAPLYAPPESSPQYKWSVDKAVEAWKAKGFPAGKLVVGVPFYGYRYAGVAGGSAGLYGTFASASALTYDKILSSYLSNPAFAKYVHADAMVPWLFDGSTFISYDDEASLSAKAVYVAEKGLAGVSVWELSQNKDGRLLAALAEGLK